jgi:signal peptidase I
MVVGRVAVAGHSMSPTLRDGEFLLYTTLLAPRRGDVVVARDPRDTRRWVVKRVRAVRDDALDLAGDLASDTHDAGWIPRDALIGRVVFRYWPLSRARFL